LLLGFKLFFVGIPHDVLEIYCPLLNEMEEMEQSLDLDEFIDASNRLYQVFCFFCQF
jgi:hypothetical protein